MLTRSVASSVMPVPSEFVNLTPRSSASLKNLEPRSMHENDLDAQRTQDRKVEQNVGKIVRSGNLSVDGNNKHTLPETGNVLEDFAQIGNVHFDDGRLPE